MDFSNPNVTLIEKEKEPVKDDQPATFKYSEDKIKEFLYSDTESKNVFCCMLYGSDGTSKSGITFNFMSDEDIRDGYKAVIIDLDGGNEPLLKYHVERCKKHNKSVKDVFIIKNPIVMKVVENDVVINYQETFALMKGMVNYVKNNWERDKIKYIAFDGLSSALKYAEYQMRLEKNVDADGGVQTRYWLIRNKIFMELLEQIKSIPISKFYIGHENFVLKDKDTNSSIIEKTNAMMHQKIRCIRQDLPDKIVFKAIIDKSKYNISQEGKEIIVGTVNKETGEYTWEGEKVFKELI